MSVQPIDARVEYKDIPGHPGYRAGSDGTVWSSRKIGHRGGVGAPWRMLVPSINKREGRYQHTLAIAGGATKTYRRATLVALAFHGLCPGGMEIRHIDGDKMNDRPDNLSYGTHAENEADKVAHGTHNRGVRHNMAKLSEDDVLAIRAQAKSGVMQQMLAWRYGVSIASVSLIVNRKTWTHI